LGGGLPTFGACQRLGRWHSALSDARIDDAYAAAEHSDLQHQSFVVLAVSVMFSVPPLTDTALCWPWGRAPYLPLTRSDFAASVGRTFALD